MDDTIEAIEGEIPALRRYARALLHDRHAADDLVQDCLERALQRRHQRTRREALRPWLFTILHRLAMDRFRQVARRSAPVALDAASEQEVAIAPAQDGALRHRDLMRGLALLPEEQRSVLLLVGVEDLSYAEAAAVLEVPIGTVMSRLSRGRERLRHWMEEGTGAPAGRPLLRRVK